MTTAPRPIAPERRDMAPNIIAAALKSAGDGADSAKLIRLGLKELAR